MKYNMPDRVLKDIEAFAKSNHIEKVILFGSRAKGTHSQRSDIDIAVLGGNFDGFYWDVKEKTHSLLLFDIVDLNKSISQELQDTIDKEGVLLYEKA